MIKVMDLCKSYGTKQVLDNINISVSMGEIHGLIGDNGAGKTTLIKCIAGIYRPDTGIILYDGKDIYDVPETKERIGYVSDRCGYVGSCKIAGILKLYEQFYPRFNRAKFEEYNKSFNLDMNTKIHSLSKGQKMRLGFMLEMAKEPDYLILDEPTSGLDPVAKSRFLELLVEEADKREIGVLISSHNLNDLEKLCDTITMLSDGKVASDASLDEFKNKLVKLQVVFEHGVDEKCLKIPEIVKISHVGSVYTMIVDGYDVSLDDRLKKMGAGFIEEIDIDLEELYVALDGRKEREQ